MTLHKFCVQVDHMRIGFSSFIARVIVSLEPLVSNNPRDIVFGQADMIHRCIQVVHCSTTKIDADGIQDDGPKLVVSLEQSLKSSGSK